MKKIGLFGGTFDPIHIGHLIMAEEAYEQVNLDEIWFIPSYVPPHKQVSSTDPFHRLEMVKQAIKDNPHFKVTDIELIRTGTSFTINTVEELKEKYPNDQFYFLIGADMVEYLPKWHKIDELMKLVQFIGVNRNGYTAKTSYPIIEIDVPLIAVSSTMLRKRLARGETTKYWLRSRVRDYIRENGLYGCKGSVK